ncbi:helix-turn-helix domain-containing protein [Streptomyces mirabilis]|uniref:helix-turn-helix domain-containing protein n=1 Tax=Streptomyces mirabilis TaxID=68239 RepID=UPI00332FB3D8
MKPLPISPETERVRIGGRLRAARQKQGLSIDAIAEVTGLTKSFLSRVERDITSPSVSSLVRICQVLSLDIGSLFREPELHLVRDGNGPRINLGGIGVDERLLTSRNEPRIQLIRSAVEPGGNSGSDLYTVLSEIEVLHVLVGRIEVLFANETFELLPGDTITFPGSEPHTWRNPDHEWPAEVIWVLAPAAWSSVSPPQAS